MKICELCKAAAMVFCESDQANLCWSCDAKVHSANFLVARHSRCLLCHVCQLPTPWSASGSDLGSTVSECERCLRGSPRTEIEADEIGDECDDDEEEEEDEVDEEEDDDDDEADSEDVQVVPWSSTPPPFPATSSSSDDSLLTDRDVSDLKYWDNRRSVSSDLEASVTGETSATCGIVIDLNNETSTPDTGRPAKIQRRATNGTDRVDRSELRSSPSVDALSRIHRPASRDRTIVTLDFSETS
ncbi:unnamed protein product [Cuscuta epithymum]|uniref:B box-type domain-containing protein n=1 Tax=Cuscuta epithymum TaxID=186058 RepID=A0AAV0CCU9_9ASTE|nr:unnamed protein product [Cuscuta epithymum]